MKRQVTRTVISATALLVMAVISPAIAQDTTAEVRTWSGQSVVLTGPWVEVFYTVVPKPAGGEETPAPPGGAPPVPGMAAGGIFQSMKHAVQEGPRPLPAHREASVLTFSRAGVELKVPLERLATLTIARQPMAGSSLPPYVGPTHHRYSATAVMTDGSRVDADYLNFGTAVLRGMTSQGRVDVRFDQIESIRFTR